jgi:hypothetical protein
MDFYLIRDRAGYSVGNVRPGFLGLGGLGSEVCPHGLIDVNTVSAASQDGLRGPLLGSGTETGSIRGRSCKRRGNGRG